MGAPRTTFTRIGENIESDYIKPWCKCCGTWQHLGNKLFMGELFLDPSTLMVVVKEISRNPTDTALHLKHVERPFQLALVRQIRQWNSQSPLTSINWNWRPSETIGVPARLSSWLVNGTPPGPDVGFMPTYKQLRDQATIRSIRLMVLPSLSSSEQSQLQIRKRLYRTGFGRHIGKLRNRQICFS